MKKLQLFRQHGAALLLMLLTLLLAVTTVVLSALNDRQDYQLNQKQQTQRALQQAKQALIGYAASYDLDHTNFIPGYLPCPDVTGDGSANPPCANQDETVLGRFPWRTLGLPPLRDGSGECLWYAVSGSFKNNPKTQATTITSNTDGDIIIQGVDDNILHGKTALNRAIAVVFAPNKPLSGQTRGGSGLKTDCGYESQPSAAANQANNYLEGLSDVNNATGSTTLSHHDITMGRFFSDTVGDDKYPTFMKAATTYDKSTGEEIFNDTLAVISPEDFAPVFKLMDYRVVSKAVGCLEKYYQDNKANFFKNYSTPIGEAANPHIGTYQADTNIKAEIELYVSERKSNCKYNNCNGGCDAIKEAVCEDQEDTCKTQCLADHPNDISGVITCTDQCTVDKSSCMNNCSVARDVCESNCESDTKIQNYYNTAIDISVSYPWAVKLDDHTFKEESEMRFGRIPSVLLKDKDDEGNITTFPLAISHGVNKDMSKTWLGDCFDETKPSWRWWEEWKDHIFYALDDEYDVSQSSVTQIWIRTEHGASVTGTGANRVWALNDRDAFVDRKKARTEATIAKLTDPSEYTGWEKGSVPPDLANPTDLKLSGINRSFIVISAGRRLDLNQSSKDYPEFTQVRNKEEHCERYSSLCSTCDDPPSTVYNQDCYKSRIDNYLEGDAYDLTSRKVVNNSMVGGNIPLDYNTQKVVTVPSADSTVPADIEFIQEDINMYFFTDFACHSTSSCKKMYKDNY
ncbi:hypothetical protein [Candidatus Albibeggiatoa sp. nov. NOAA]|uniref:hypothetical protein n=1 Tax=Candidatus Albibeggiatoa sp. nov. NOAA TaxID=3162724 RepID=UPI0032F7265E|nr:hypothetical protein [Thiotrichaceae bacterium]